MNVGESLPQNRLTSIDLKQQAGTGFELISLLNSVKLSMQVRALLLVTGC